MKLISVFVLLLASNNLFSEIAGDVLIVDRQYASPELVDSVFSKSKLHSSPEEFWSLTNEEWNRYLFIKENSPWSIWENSATPLAILAHYSENIQEKVRYARIAAELDQWKQHIVTEWQQIYNNEREVVYAKYAEYIGKRIPITDNILPNDRIAFFVDYKNGKCGARCAALLNKIQKTQAHIDIYLIGVTSEDEIFKWALDANISVESVRAKRVSLNYDTGQFQNASLSPLKELPAVYLKTDNGYKEVVR